MKLKLIFVTLSLFVLTFMPFLAIAQSDLIFCNTKASTDGKSFVDANGQLNNCGFEELLTLVINFINFIIIKVAIPISALSFAYAGFLILTAAGNPGQVSKGREIFTKVATGLAVSLAAWLIVNLIITALLQDGYSLLS